MLACSAATALVRIRAACIPALWRGAATLLQVLPHRRAALHMPHFHCSNLPIMHLTSCISHHAFHNLFSPIPGRYSYIDVLRYAWGALMKNQFGGDRDVEVWGLPPAVGGRHWQFWNTSPACLSRPCTTGSISCLHGTTPLATSCNWWAARSSLDCCSTAGHQRLLTTSMPANCQPNASFPCTAVCGRAVHPGILLAGRHQRLGLAGHRGRLCGR